MTLEELLSRKSEILKVAEKYGASNVRIFGSVARREENTRDIDVLVDLEPGRGLFDLGGLTMELRELLHSKVDVLTENSLKDRVKSQVLKEAVSL